MPRQTRVNINLKFLPGVPAENMRVRFTLSPDDQDLLHLWSDSILIGKDYETITDSSGVGFIDIPVPDAPATGEDNVAWKWRVTLPEKGGRSMGKFFRLAVPYSASGVDLHTLILNDGLDVDETTTVDLVSLLTGYQVTSERGQPGGYHYAGTSEYFYTGTGSIDSLVTVIGANKAKLYVRGNSVITGTTSIPENVSVVVERGAVFSGTGSLTISGPVEAGPHLVFDISAGLSVTLGSANRQILPEWFGADNDVASDSAAAVNAAIQSATTATTYELYSGYDEEMGAAVVFRAGFYKFTGQILMRSRVSLVGAGRGLTVLMPDDAALAGKFLIDSAQLSGTNRGGHHSIRRLTIAPLPSATITTPFNAYYGPQPSLSLSERRPDAAGIRLQDSEHVTISDVGVHNLSGSGLSIEGSQDVVIHNVEIMQCGTDENTAGLSIVSVTRDGDTVSRPPNALHFGAVRVESCPVTLFMNEHPTFGGPPRDVQFTMCKFEDRDSTERNGASVIVRACAGLKFAACEFASDNTFGLSHAMVLLDGHQSGILTALTGTVSTTASSTAVVGVGTLFLTELTTSDRIVINGVEYRIASITDDLNLVLDADTPAQSTLSGVSASKTSPSRNSVRGVEFVGASGFFPGVLGQKRWIEATESRVDPVHINGGNCVDAGSDAIKGNVHLAGTAFANCTAPIANVTNGSISGITGTAILSDSSDPDDATATNYVIVADKSSVQGFRISMRTKLYDNTTPVQNVRGIKCGFGCSGTNNKFDLTGVDTVTKVVAYFSSTENSVYVDYAPAPTTPFASAVASGSNTYGKPFDVVVPGGALTALSPEKSGKCRIVFESGVGSWFEYYDEVDAGGARYLRPLLKERSPDLDAGQVYKIGGDQVVKGRVSAVGVLSNSLSDNTRDGTLEAIGDTTLSNQGPAIERNFSELWDQVNKIVSNVLGKTGHGLTDD